MASPKKQCTGAVVMCDPLLLVDATVGAGMEKHMEKKLGSKKEFSRIFFKLEKTEEY